jgi:hypothetical protein
MCWKVFPSGASSMVLLTFVCHEVPLGIEAVEDPRRWLESAADSLLGAVLGSAVCLRLVRHLDHRAATQCAAALFGASQAWVDVYGHGPFDDAGRARTTEQDVAYVHAGPERFSAGMATGRSCDYFTQPCDAAAMRTAPDSHGRRWSICPDGPCTGP